MTENRLLAQWQPEAATAEEEPIAGICTEPLNATALKARWLRHMLIWPHPNGVCCSKEQSDGHVKPGWTLDGSIQLDWSGYCYAAKRPDLVVVRACGRVKCRVCGKRPTVNDFTIYEIHTKEQFDREATWAVAADFRPQILPRGEP